MLLRIGCALLCLSLLSASRHTAVAQEPESEFACRPQRCSTLLPAGAVDAPGTTDCAYRNGNQWWLDYVAGSLAWSQGEPRTPVTVAIFDDGAEIEHHELRNQLWVNEKEASGRPGVDDDANGYVDDLHGWDFVDEDPTISPEGECRGRASHGTFMASLVAARRNNGTGIAAAGADGARVMVLRIVGCSRDEKDRADPIRLRRALDYATRMGARILSFSAHWDVSSPELDAAFEEIADRAGSDRAALIVASVPNYGAATAGYPAAYSFRRIIRAIPIGNADTISPGTSPAPIGLNLGAPSACVMGATAAPSQYAVENGSSNSTAILAGLLAGIWSSERYATLSADEFLAVVVQKHLLQTSRRSRAGSRPPYLQGVPLADACILASPQQSARVCRQP